MTARAVSAAQTAAETLEMLAAEAAISMTATNGTRRADLSWEA
jgi:hypothetical protein